MCSGDSSWGQVPGVPGRLRASQGASSPLARIARLAGEARRRRRLRERIVAVRSLHGKEAVPGSSPGEGLNTCKSAISEDCGVPLDHGEPGSSQREGAENSLQIKLCLAQRSTSLRGRDSTWRPWPAGPKVAGTEDTRDRAAGPLNLGDRFWGQGRAFRTEQSVAQDVVRVVRVLSESTNSSM